MLTSIALRIVAFFPPRLQNTVRQFLKFGVVGVIGATVDFGSYNILTRGFDWNDTFLIGGYEFITANLVSVFLAIMSNFTFNKYWTFHDSGGEVVKQWSGYFVMNTITFILNQILTSFFTFRVPIIEAVFGSQKDNIAKALSICFILFLNFGGSKFLIFRKRASR